MSESSSYQILEFPSDKIPPNFIAMIYAKWLRNYRHGNKYLRIMDSPTYHKHSYKVINAIIYSPKTSIKFAVLAEDHDVVLGFCVYRKEILDYIYVNREFREIGIGKALLPATIKHFTHMTEHGLLLWRARYKHLNYNPFLKEDHHDSD